MASSKLRSAVAEEEAECALDMSPMIDMVFLLLIFFIVNATAIIVKTDPEVKPPVADSAVKQKDGSGRIVVNIRKDGVFTAENFTTILADEDAIEQLVKAEAEKIRPQGITPKLHLRGDKDTVFRHCRKVVAAAARAGVDQVVFGVFHREP
jgi:biopolymer transport protein ExbD